MLLGFAGTRGEIELRSRSHARHSVLIVSYRRSRVMVDCGIDWPAGIARSERRRSYSRTRPRPRRRCARRRPRTCLRDRRHWGALKRWPIEERETIGPRVPFTVAPRGLVGVALAEHRGGHATNEGAWESRIRRCSAGWARAGDVFSSHSLLDPSPNAVGRLACPVQPKQAFRDRAGEPMQFF